MDVFDLRNRLVSDYRDYTRSFIKIHDPRIGAFVDGILDAEGFWPEPLLQLNPTFSPGGTIDDLVAEGVLHEECSRIFRIGKSDADHCGKLLHLHRHQRKAILKVAEGRSCVLTTGTGSWQILFSASPNASPAMPDRMSFAVQRARHRRRASPGSGGPCGADPRTALLPPPRWLVPGSAWSDQVPLKQSSIACRHVADGRSKYTPRRMPAAGSMPRMKR